jgi:carbonic anhydrase/acetyltransferase-like protein (isoleucine patch superfamily)
MPIIPYKGAHPTVDPTAFVAPDAWVTGKTTVGKDVSIFFGVSVRGDILAVSIGEGSNLQEHAVVHTSKGIQDCIIGPGTTVGHGAIIHGCTIAGHAIIGMGATVLDGATIEEGCIIGAQTLVPMNMKIPRGHLAVGVPAKIVRALTDLELDQIEDSWKRYVIVGREYRAHLGV